MLYTSYLCYLTKSHYDTTEQRDYNLNRRNGVEGGISLPNRSIDPHLLTEALNLDYIFLLCSHFKPMESGSGQDQSAHWTPRVRRLEDNMRRVPKAAWA